MKKFKSPLWDIQIPGQKSLGLEKIVLALLKLRGLKTNKQIDQFFTPPHPTKIKLEEVGINSGSLSKAIKRISKTINSEKRVVIYGDYDADGVCATGLLWETLFLLTKKVTPYIPNRFSEGYGINPKSVLKIKQDYPDLDLIITVDNGIVALDGIKEANKLGVDVIVTDHHTKGPVLPDAHSIIHTTVLSGSGISWFLGREIMEVLGGEKHNAPLLELPAIGTVADQIPVSGPNRSIVKFGLEDLNSTSRPGFRALMEKSGLVFGINKPFLTTYDINFVFAPRINAMGRMEQAIDSLRLVCTRDKARAEYLADYLEKTNKARQEIVKNVIDSSFSKSKNEKGVIIVSGKYHEGVIGLAAGKLTEEYYLPSIVISEGAEVSKGSARSIPGFNIIEAIRSVGDIILGGGGHPMAAGFSIKTKNLAKFKKLMKKVSGKFLTKELLKRRLKIDMTLQPEDITLELLMKINAFEPFGFGNPAPVFSTDDLTVIDASRMGSENQHIRITAEKNENKFEIVGFNMGYRYYELFPGVKLDIAYSLGKNTWKGSTKLQLILKDFRTNTKK